MSGESGLLWSGFIGQEGSAAASYVVHVENDVNVEEISEETQLKLKVIKNIGGNHICFCGFMSPDIGLVFNHVDSHKGWQEYIKPEGSRACVNTIVSHT